MNKLTLSSIGSKNTPIRSAVLSVFESTDKPISIKDVLKKLKIPADEATVYRVINFFVKKSILIPILIEKNITRYELAGNKHHHHIVCDDCGDIEDIEDVSLEKALNKITNSSKKFKLINNHSLEFFGICRPCQKK